MGITTMCAKRLRSARYGGTAVLLTVAMTGCGHSDTPLPDSAFIAGSFTTSAIGAPQCKGHFSWVYDPQFTSGDDTMRHVKFSHDVDYEMASSTDNTCNFTSSEAGLKPGKWVVSVGGASCTVDLKPGGTTVQMQTCAVNGIPQ